MKSILVVEDDIAVGETIRSILEDSAYDVCVFAHPTQLPAGSSPALLITDLACNGGYCSADAVSEIQALRVRTAAPILVLTAHAAAREDEQLARAANAVLTKPFEMVDLLAAVERLAV